MFHVMLEALKNSVYFFPFTLNSSLSTLIKLTGIDVIFKCCDDFLRNQF